MPDTAQARQILPAVPQPHVTAELGRAERTRLSSELLDRAFKLVDGAARLVDLGPDNGGELFVNSSVHTPSAGLGKISILLVYGYARLQFKHGDSTVFCEIDPDQVTVTAFTDDRKEILPGDLGYVSAVLEMAERFQALEKPIERMSFDRIWALDLPVAERIGHGLFAIKRGVQAVFNTLRTKRDALASDDGGDQHLQSIKRGGLSACTTFGRYLTIVRQALAEMEGENLVDPASLDDPIQSLNETGVLLQQASISAHDANHLVGLLGAVLAKLVERVEETALHRSGLRVPAVQSFAGT